MSLRRAGFLVLKQFAAPRKIASPSMFGAHRALSFGNRRWKQSDSTVDDSNSRPVDFSLSPAANKSLPFVDTHETVKMLTTQGGFSEREAEAITLLVVQALALIYEQNAKNLVSKTYAEITTQQLMQHIASLKKDMAILEKSEFSALRSENEKQQIEIKQLRESVRDEMAKVSSNLKLDLNIEKSRSREDQALLQASLHKLNNRIDMEGANLRTLFEQYRNDIFKYAAGTILSVLTILLGFYRLWTH